MLGGPQARADAADVASKFGAIVHISSPTRPDLTDQIEMMLDRVKLAAVAVTAKDDSEVAFKNVAQEAVVVREGDRGRVDAHVKLWRECASGSKPFLILEDGLMMPPKVGEATAHCTAVVNRMCDPEHNPVILYLGGVIDPSQWKEQWLPTNLQQPNGERVVLREAERVYQSCAYVVWPLAAMRLLSSLPLRTAVDEFIHVHLMQQSMRALVVQPLLVAQHLEQYVPPVPVTRYRVVYKRVAVRNAPQPNGFIEGGLNAGDEVLATEHSPDGKWAHVDGKGWVLLAHDQYGTLLERIEEDDDASTGMM